MKKVCEIPECNKLLDEMFSEWEKIAKVPNKVKYSWKTEQEYKAIEKEYLPKIFEVYNKYKQEHPEEFKDES